ncbi:MAG: hypothetical protein LBQ08_03050, partial [Holosporaceae bacterium]|nr:hypothetical protein [Holosporaceae bacterium]
MAEGFEKMISAGKTLFYLGNEGSANLPIVKHGGGGGPLGFIEVTIRFTVCFLCFFKNLFSIK